MNGKTGHGDVKVRGNIEAKGEGAGKRRSDRGGSGEVPRCKGNERM